MERKQIRRFSSTPISLNFGFLLACLSRQALDLARTFLPLPSYCTISEHFHDKIDPIESGLCDISCTGQQIERFIAANDISPNSLISLSIGAMSMNTDHRYLPGKDGDFAFVFYAQPLDRQVKCFPLHVMPQSSGQATTEVQRVIEFTCDALRHHNLVPKHICSDGDQGYNERHRLFFIEWYPIYFEHGLQAVVAHASGAEMIHVSAFLHLWKCDCNKVKNHPVTLRPDSSEHVIDCDTFDAILALGPALLDKSPIRLMRDSYALQLFAYVNCLKFIQKDELNGIMYLLPWTLQEEIVRSANMSREDRLMKAVLSFKLFIHYFHLTCLPKVSGFHRDSIAHRQPL
jgi:hypothetical protein